MGVHLNRAALAVWQGSGFAVEQNRCRTHINLLVALHIYAGSISNMILFEVCGTWHLQPSLVSAPAWRHLASWTALTTCQQISNWQYSLLLRTSKKVRSAVCVF